MQQAIDYFIWRNNCMACLPSNSNWHYHPAIQLYCSPLREITVELDDQQQQSGHLLAIPSHRVRRVLNDATIIQFAFNPIAPDRQEIHSLQELQVSEISQQLGDACGNFIEQRDIDAAVNLKQALQQLLFSIVERGIMDERIKAVLAMLARHYSENPTISELAAAVQLSASRLQHLFKEQTGITLLAYLQWLRLRLSFQLIAQGRKPLEAALAVGFSDQAHFSRLFKRAFGYKPSELLKQHGRARVTVVEAMYH